MHRHGNALPKKVRKQRANLPWESFPPGSARGCALSIVAAMLEAELWVCTRRRERNRMVICSEWAWSCCAHTWAKGSSKHYHSSQKSLSIIPWEKKKKGKAKHRLRTTLPGNSIFVS